MAADTAAIALGSNLGDPLYQLRRARRELERCGALLRASAIYRTAPVGGPAGQPDYLNAVVLLRPSSHLEEPLALLRRLHRIERLHCRSRRVRWASRTLDLDLLSYGGRVVELPGLSLPHPRMLDRAFVLAPLCEVSPHWQHPATGTGACEALRAAGTQGVERTGLTWGAG